MTSANRLVFAGVLSSLVFVIAPGCTEPDEKNPDLMQMAQSLPSGPATTSTPPHCAGWNVFEIHDQPIYWDQPGSPTFTYSFQIEFATGDYRNAPVGIVVYGGPGVPSIGLGRGTIFPPTFNVIYTDVRGVGCNINADNPFQVDALNTDYYSRDVLSIVKALGLKDYVLFGVSYGTVHGTVMTNIAEREGIQPPSALVLEGILGTWQINQQEIVDYNKQWNLVKARLPASVVDSFSRTPLPLGYSSRKWASFLGVTLNEGTTPAIGNSTLYYLAPLATGDPVGEARIHAKMDELATPTPPGTARIGAIGLCTETKGKHTAKDLVNGVLVDADPDYCQVFGLGFDRPYDSAAYPVTVPIYYFEGSSDPNTSPENALHHYANQTQADRVFTLVWGGGHQDLTKTLHQTGCTPAIFHAIAAKPPGVGLAAALEQCHWLMTVDNREAGE